jgi:tripartite-type tricarboxylate transporter receptor subunit TctC
MNSPSRFRWTELRRAVRAGIALAIAGLALAACSAAESAGTYPTKPIRIFVPYGPGGVGDLTMRVLAQKLGENVKQRLVIENRPGAGGILAAKAGASAPPDGYTLALTGNGTAISKSLFKSLPYDVLRDFKSVSVMAWLDLTIATKADGPLKTVSDIVAAAKKDPGKLNFGTIAPGSTQHLSAELFRLTADIKVAMVTFRTTPDLVTAILRGDVDVGFDYLAGLRAQMNDQGLRAVASTGEKRSPSTPNVPTVSESGMPDYVVTSWNAVSVPAGTPDDIVRFLSKEINEALKSPDIQAKALQFGLDARGTTPEEMQARMRADIEKWGAVIEKAGLEKQ